MTGPAEKPGGSDRLTLRGLTFVGRHGAFDEEQVAPQPFEVDIVIHGDLSAAAESDDLDRTVDYRVLFEVARRNVEDRSHRLIEGIAGAIADECLAAADPAVANAIEVRVRKPRVPLPGSVETVEATVVRRRPTPPRAASRA